MRVTRERLIFHSICVLEDVADEALEVGRTPPRASVRLALGILYAFRRDTDGVRVIDWHRQFWHNLTYNSATNVDTAWGFGRKQTFTSLINGIARAAGMSRDHRYDEARRKMRGL